jgi:hypothetical protein
MNSVLMLCYYFPPLSGGGVQRSSKFVKYLPEWGWRPVVVSVEPNRRNSLEYGVDASLLSDVGKETEIYRGRSFEFASLYYLFHKARVRGALLELEYMVPLLGEDYKIGWYRSARAQASRRIAKGGTEKGAQLAVGSRFP